MPELPEVETTLRGIEPHIDQQRLTRVVVRNARLRWPVPVGRLEGLVGQNVTKVERIAKYILIYTDLGVVLLHLGMSGSLRVLDSVVPAAKHDHIDLVFSNNKVVRLNDPRRFGCCLVLQEPVAEHKLLASLGPEPLSEAFNAARLYELSRGRSVSVKNFIMDGKVVVGVGNIYASESLFRAGIRPTTPIKRISKARYESLTQSIKDVLGKAITAGGTTLNDFTQADGKPGYFAQELQVYGREGEPCNECTNEIKAKVIGQRNTFYCSTCQK